MVEDEGRWEQLIRGLRAGDPQASRAFWEQYGPLLQQVAERRLPRGLRARVGPEDVVQSVCRTFLRRAKGGEFRFDDSEGLWQLLCAITLTKVREQTRFHLRQKRGVDQEVRLSASSAETSSGGFGVSDPGPTPGEAAEFADLFQQLLAGLDDEERQVAELKLQDRTNDEVAEALGCSERTVRRVLKRVQARLERMLDARCEDT